MRLTLNSQRAFTLFSYKTFKEINNALAPLFTEAINTHVFPGAVAAITIGQEDVQQSLVQPFGNYKFDNCPVSTETFYDLASLTKTITALAILSLLHEKKLTLDQSLGDLFRQQVTTDKAEITISQLLNHSSGLPAHRPYFENLRTLSPEKRSDILIEKILQEPLDSPPGQKQLYSDLGFILLGRIIEIQSNQKLDDYIAEKIFSPLNLNKTLFFNSKRMAHGRYAPTEQCQWRKKLLCGQVHDDNCYAVGGVSGQAGLFGNIWGIMDLVNFIKDFINKRQEHPNLSSEDVLKAVQPQNPHQGTWGLGFDTPSTQKSSSGHYFSSNSFGHLGFTGTSFWVDLERDISVVLLTNRVYPDRDNIKIRDFRPIFHNTVMKIVTQGAKRPGTAS